MQKMGWFRVVMGHSRSTAMSPFDRAHTTSYSTLIETNVPLLFLLYTAELFDIIAGTGLTSHSYADDTQLYISAPAPFAMTTVQQFVSCVEKVDAWMSSNQLKMNADKTQLICSGHDNSWTS